MKAQGAQFKLHPKTAKLAEGEGGRRRRTAAAVATAAATRAPGGAAPRPKHAS